ncbi:MAG: DUF5615 family PIN-like protein [Oscillatoria princeps RMCB-10]|jgi:hypothetical protein|nr:DUF5615 family PIN-like protein [Oscillatoria princeps RMCB-10]
MSLQYLLDENVEPTYKTQLHRRNSNIVMWVVGEPGAPSRGTLDPEILCRCEAYNFVLVTNNRTSMPVHLIDHIESDRHVPGIFILNPKMSRGQTIEELIFVAEASFEKEYQDRIVNLPVS